MQALATSHLSLRSITRYLYDSEMASPQSPAQMPTIPAVAPQTPSPTFEDMIVFPTIEDTDHGAQSGHSSLCRSSPLSPPPEDKMPNRTEPVSNASKVRPKVHAPLPSRHRSPRSSLPPWKYISPRLTNEFVRSPSAMAHRAYTPTVERSARPTTSTPDGSELFEEHGLHGQTTYTSMPLEQAENALMAGRYLNSSMHRRGILDQVNAIEDYYGEDIEARQDAEEKRRRRTLGFLPGKWAYNFANQNTNTSPQFKSSWHAADDGPAIIRTGNGTTTYWSHERAIASVREKGKNPKPLKKQHKKFTSPVQQIVEEGVQSYLEALSDQYPTTAPEARRPPSPKPAMLDLDPPLSSRSPSSSKATDSNMRPPRNLPRYIPPSAPPKLKIKIVGWKIFNCRELMYKCRLENAESASL